MTEGNWGKLLIAALILVDVLLGVRILNDSFVQAPSYRGASATGTKELTLGPFEIVTPAAEPNPGRQEWREEQNVYAQRQMADWSLLMLIVSGAGIVITGAGVWLIRATLLSTEAGLSVMRETLDEARQATIAGNRNVDETRRIGEAQVRAYLTFEQARFSVEGGELRLGFEVNNCGQSPARLLLAKQVSCSIVMSGTSDDILHFQGVYGDPFNVFLGSHRAGSNARVSIPLMLNEQDVRTFDREAKTRRTHISVSGLLTWNDVFNQQHSQPFTADKFFNTGFEKNSAETYLNTDAIKEDHVIARWKALRKDQ